MAFRNAANEAVPYLSHPSPPTSLSSSVTRPISVAAKTNGQGYVHNNRSVFVHSPYAITESPQMDLSVASFGCSAEIPHSRDYVSPSSYQSQTTSSPLPFTSSSTDTRARIGLCTRTPADIQYESQVSLSSLPRSMCNHCLPGDPHCRAMYGVGTICPLPYAKAPRSQQPISFPDARIPRGLSIASSSSRHSSPNSYTASSLHSMSYPSPNVEMSLVSGSVPSLMPTDDKFRKRDLCPSTTQQSSPLASNVLENLAQFLERSIEQDSASDACQAPPSKYSISRPTPSSPKPPIVGDSQDHEYAIAAPTPSRTGSKDRTQDTPEDPWDTSSLAPTDAEQSVLSSAEAALIPKLTVSAKKKKPPKVPNAGRYSHDAPCEHTAQWKRCRWKKGMTQLYCHQCGAKWKSAKLPAPLLENSTKPSDENDIDGDDADGGVH